MVAPTALDCVCEPRRAAVLIEPLRQRILEEMRAAPCSASDVARRLRLPRQKVNYHVRQLFAARFLRRAGRGRRRNLWEQRYVAAASAIVLSPEVLGPLGQPVLPAADRLSAGWLFAQGARLLHELGRAWRQSRARAAPLPTLSLDALLRFTSAAQRARFARALEEAVSRVVAEHASPAESASHEPAPGMPFRLVIGCYPVPEDPTSSTKEKLS